VSLPLKPKQKSHTGLLASELIWNLTMKGAVAVLILMALVIMQLVIMYLGRIKSFNCQSQMTSTDYNNAVIPNNNNNRDT
jgi:hypothetical protein